jgi:hypothetical protein
MKVAFRAVAVSVVLSLAWAGPLAPLATAQQPAAPPVIVVTPPPPVAPPPVYQEQVMVSPPPRPGIDGYDVGAVAMTAFGFPFKIAICGIGFAAHIIVFAGSFAARPDASMGILDEACGSKAHWIIRGEDIRTRPSATKAFEWETHRYQGER